MVRKSMLCRSCFVVIVCLFVWCGATVANAKKKGSSKPCERVIEFKTARITDRIRCRVRERTESDQDFLDIGAGYRKMELEPSISLAKIMDAVDFFWHRLHDPLNPDYPAGDTGKTEKTLQGEMNQLCKELGCSKKFKDLKLSTSAKSDDELLAAIFKFADNYLNELKQVKTITNAAYPNDIRETYAEIKVFLERQH